MNIKEIEDNLNKKFNAILANMNNIRDNLDVYPHFRIEESKHKFGIRYSVYMTNKDIPYIGKIFFALMEESELRDALYVIDRILELLKEEFLRFN